jgi:hypothetical protein
LDDDEDLDGDDSLDVGDNFYGDVSFGGKEKSLKLASTSEKRSFSKRLSRRHNNRPIDTQDDDIQHNESNATECLKIAIDNRGGH